MTTATKPKDAHASVQDIDAALAANSATSDQPEPPAPTTKDDKPAAQPTRRRRTKAATNEKADEAPAVEPYKLKAFTERTVPWGQLGTVTDGAKTATEAAKLSGLDFEVELLEAGFKSSKPAKVAQSPWKSVGSRRACVRKDNQLFFSYVSAGYTPVQYNDAFSFMDGINPRYVAAGALGNGRQGFIVVKLPNIDVLEFKLGKKVDELDVYAILRTSHDLTRAIEVSVMTLRGRCMNALTLNAFTSGALQRWSQKHVGKDPVAKLAAATNTLRRSEAYAKSFLDTASALASIKLTMEDAEGVLRRVLPDKPKRPEQIGAILHAWRESPTGGFPDNGWGLVNGVAEYFEWGRNEGTRTDQSRFTGSLTGQTHRFTNRTAQALLQRRR